MVRQHVCNFHRPPGPSDRRDGLFVATTPLEPRPRPTKVIAPLIRRTPKNVASRIVHGNLWTRASLGLMRRRSPIALSVLCAGVQRPVEVAVAEIPGLTRNDRPMAPRTAHTTRVYQPLPLTPKSLVIRSVPPRNSLFYVKSPQKTNRGRETATAPVSRPGIHKKRVVRGTGWTKPRLSRRSTVPQQGGWGVLTALGAGRALPRRSPVCRGGTRRGVVRVRVRLSPTQPLFRRLTTWPRQPA